MRCDQVNVPKENLYGWRDANSSHMHKHFMPPLLDMCSALNSNSRVLDVGCGNGYTAGVFASRGCNVVGIDTGTDGIEIARRNYPKVRFEILTADESLLSKLGCDPFDLVVSTEVVEHLYDPQGFARGCFHALRPGGRIVLSTPYHGYLKNLAIALFNGFDKHMTPLWRGGHIKFWSRETLSRLLTDAGFVNLQFRGAGRLRFLWMTMLMAGDRPLE